MAKYIKKYLRTGKAPLGYSYNATQGWIIPRPKILEALAEVDEVIKAGEMGYRLAAQWFLYKTGVLISHEGLRKRLRDGVYLYGDRGESEDLATEFGTDTEAEEGTSEEEGSTASQVG